MQYKEIVIGVIVALLVVVGFTFRGKIFHPSLEVPSAEQSAPVNDQTTISSSTSNNPQSQGNISVVPENQNNKTLPVYGGRPLGEIKFNPDILKSTSDQRRVQLSADIRKYAKIVKEAPEYIAAWLQIAGLKKIIGDYEGARDIWIYLTVLRPHEITALLNLGDLYTYYLKDYPKAEQNLRAAIRLDQKNEMAYIRLSQLYRFFYKEKIDLAEKVLQEGLATNPGNVNLSKELASLQEKKSKP